MKTPFGPLIFVVPVFLLGGCGFHPMYGDYSRPTQGNVAASAAMEQVGIDIVPNREGQMLRNNLMDRLYHNGYPSNPTANLHVDELKETITKLDLTKASESTRAQLRLETLMTLKDGAGKPLLSRPIKSIVSYNILGSEFATRVTEDDARRSAINDIARQIELNLSLYYNGQIP